MWRLREHPSMRPLVAAVLWAGYLVTFVPLYASVGPTVLSLAVVPAGATGWLYGFRAGLAAGLLVFPLNVALITLAGGQGTSLATAGGALGSALVVVLSTVAGRMKEDRDRLERELAARRQAEAALQDREARLHQITAAAQDAIIMLDPAGRITLWNQAAERMFGYRSAEVLGRELHPLLAPPDQLPACRRGIAHFSATGQGPAIGRTLELEGLHRDGHIIPVEVSMSAVQIDSQWHAIGIVRDISERQRFQARLERYAAELEQANEEIRHFAYIVSHDLRAPLVNLKGFAAELRYSLEPLTAAVAAAAPHLTAELRQQVEEAQAEVAEALGFIDTAVENMDRLIGAVLKMSRLGRRKLELEEVNMQEVVEAVVDTLAHELAARGARVEVGPLPTVTADRTAVEQIVANILTNAVKYLDPKRPGRIQVSATNGQDGPTFHIRDNGRGIAAADMPKVFAPFRRAGVQDVPGEGMGLAYVQTLVQLHGGRVWCESEPGAGSVFSFTLGSPKAKGSNGD